MTILMDGLAHAEKIRAKLTEDIQADLHQGRLLQAPKLIAICVGNNPSARIYVRMKQRACHESNILSEILYLEQQTEMTELMDVIKQLNRDETVSGILLQHPLPPQIDTRTVFDAIASSKDVDGVNSSSFGKTSLGADAFPTCTPAGMIDLLQIYKIALEGKHMVVVGRSPILGRPMAMQALNKNATVTLCHSRTKDLPSFTRQADILVAACGKPHFIIGEWLQQGVVVLDAGFNAGNVGDTDFTSCSQKASYITPVPGGVGPMTIAHLLKNTYHSELRATQRRQAAQAAARVSSSYVRQGQDGAVD